MEGIASVDNAWEGMGIGCGGNRRPAVPFHAVILSEVTVSRTRSSGAVEGPLSCWRPQRLRKEFTSRFATLSL